jgi:hypothetical protein
MPEQDKMMAHGTLTKNDDVYSMKKYNILQFLFLMITIGSNSLNIAFANDGAFEVKNPRLKLIEPSCFEVSCIDITILLQNTLTMTPRKKNLEVSYDFVCISKNKMTTILEFIIPAYRYNGPAWWYPDRSFQEIELQLNEKKMSFNRITRALFGDKDITQELTAFGISPNVIDGEMQASDGNIQRYSDLIAKKYMSLLEIAPNEAILIHHWVTTNRYWISFDSMPGEKVRLSYRHRLLPGASTIRLQENPYTDDISNDNLLERLKVTPKNIMAMLDGRGKYGYANMHWYTIPIANFIQDKKSKIVKININSDDYEETDGNKRIIFVKFDNNNIYSAYKNMSIELKNYIIENDIFIVVFDRM